MKLDNQSKKLACISIQKGEAISHSHLTYSKTDPAI